MRLSPYIVSGCRRKETVGGTSQSVESDEGEHGRACVGLEGESLLRKGCLLGIVASNLDLK